MRPLFSIFAVLCVLSCGVFTSNSATAEEKPGKSADKSEKSADKPEKDADDDAPDTVVVSWAKKSQSPQKARPAAADAKLHALCGHRELGLNKVATAIIERRLSGGTAFPQRTLERIARSAGVPYPYVAAWSRMGTAAQPRVRGVKTQKRLAKWLSKRPVQGRRRCGVARGTNIEGREVVAVVIADALAELTAFPTTTKVSRWLELEAIVHPNATTAKVVILGPRGRPKRVLASLGDGTVKSRFMLDTPGRWIVQLVAGMPTGPKPVLEMEVFAGIDAPEEILVDKTTKTSKHDSRDLLRWLNRARDKEGLSAVKRSKKLDRLARAHAIAMVRKNRVAHNVGKGTPRERVGAASLRAQRVGENVARAATVRRIHDALWDSPSHRENMLDSSFRYVGVAAVKDVRGRVWSVQLYTDRL